MGTLDEYKVDHLILLVGGNPLPNYVAARVLGSKQITLVHSAGTESIAQRLKRALEACGGGQAVDLREVDESRAPSIYKGVHKCLEEHDLPSAGLHYTGGTKAMAVHAYRAVANWSKDNAAGFVASYLDARTQHLVIDDEHSPREEYVGDKLPLSLEEMLQLHGWTLPNALRTVPMLPRSASAIARACASDCIVSAKPGYQEWKTSVLYRACKRENSDRWRANGDLKKTTIDWPAGGKLDDVAVELRHELNLTSAQLDIGAAYKQLGMSEPEDFCKWLDGLWLEHYLLDVLQAIAEADIKPNPGQAFQGVKPKEVDLDLDVVAVVGYQLFAFSCGTAIGAGTRAQLKHKLFEAILRARQLGGDQARVALVSVCDDPAGLQAEARQQIDPEDQAQIRVFGCKDLADLKRCLESWMRKQRSR